MEDAESQFAPFQGTLTDIWDENSSWIQHVHGMNLSNLDSSKIDFQDLLWDVSREEIHLPDIQRS